MKSWNDSIQLTTPQKFFLCFLLQIQNPLGIYFLVILISRHLQNMDFDFDSTFEVFEDINSKHLVSYFLVSFFVGAVATIVRWIYIR